MGIVFAALKDMALPPCHMMCQFYVNGSKLSCLVRGDVFVMTSSLLLFAVCAVADVPAFG